MNKGVEEHAQREAKEYQRYHQAHAVEGQSPGQHEHT